MEVFKIKRMKSGQNEKWWQVVIIKSDQMEKWSKLSD